MLDTFAIKDKTPANISREMLTGALPSTIDPKL